MTPEEIINDKPESYNVTGNSGILCPDCKEELYSPELAAIFPIDSEADQISLFCPKCNFVGTKPR